MNDGIFQSALILSRGSRDHEDNAFEINSNFLLESSQLSNELFLFGLDDLDMDGLFPRYS
jgi:hypothetical protein